MKTVKLQKLTTVPFVEGGNLQQILMQLTKVCRKVLFTIKGTITITNLTGTVVPEIAASTDGTTLFPYLLLLAGKLSFEGTRTDAGKGIKIQNLPIWLLWLEAYMLNDGVGPVVTDGGMSAAGFAAATYNIVINFSVLFYDPMTPTSQHNISFFRPICYNNQPYWQITGGTLFQANYQANSDDVATTGLTTNPSSITYTTALTVYTTAVLVPDMKQSPSDVCADVAYEYNPQYNANAGQFNNVALADLEVQAYIHFITTNRALAGGAGTALVESGVQILGANNNNIVETDIGTDQLNYAYIDNMVAENYEEFMTSVSAIPLGLVVIDEYGHNWNEWQKKTFLQPGAAQHLMNTNGAPQGTPGSNFRILHKTYNLSASAKKSVGVFPRFAGQ